MDTKEALMLSRTPHIVKLMIEDLKDDEDAQRLEGHLEVVQGIILELTKERDAQAAELTRLRAAQPAVPDDVAKDAARYRFLRSDGRCDVYVFEHYLSRKELDAAIDAAIISATEGRSNG